MLCTAATELIFPRSDTKGETYSEYDKAISTLALTLKLIHVYVHSGSDMVGRPNFGLVDTVYRKNSAMKYTE